MAMVAASNQKLQLRRFSQAMCPAKVSKNLIAWPDERGESPQQTWHFATAGWLQRVSLDESYGEMTLARLWLGKVNVAQQSAHDCRVPNRTRRSPPRRGVRGYPVIVFAYRPRL
jgi:hypothetical protein